MTMKQSSRPRSIVGLVATLLALCSSVSSAAEIRSRTHPGVRVSFKETRICETTPGVRGYSGYVTLPRGPEARESNLFFWFFESRRSPGTAPLAVWLNGGPGGASTDQAVGGHNGPCAVEAGSAATRLNQNSWNEVANMLYVDQPGQVGFSYDSVVDGVLDTATGDVDVGNATAAPGASQLLIKGRFSSQNPANTANSTQSAAVAVYHLLQIWFDEFKQYRRDSVSVWSQSYGGHYVPGLADIINKEFKSPGSVVGSGSSSSSNRNNNNNKPHRFSVDSAGIINGLVDLATQMPYFNDFSVNNTYGIRAYDDATHAALDRVLRAEGEGVGCMATLRACRDLLAERDPGGLVPPSLLLDGRYQKVCGATLELCGPMAFGFAETSGLYAYDLAQPVPHSFPRPYGIGWLNRPEVLEALGARVNYTEGSMMVGRVFQRASDIVRSGFLEKLAGLVDDGVKVALIYGDRDHRCNWVGGEAVSLGVKHSEASDFAAAGYADILVGGGGSAAGKVRQHGLYSFSRIYNAGHDVPSYKGAEALEIFRRTVSGRDVATGRVDAAARSAAGARYRTAGPPSVFDVRVPLERPAPEGEIECYTLALPVSLRCTPNQISALGNGTAVVRDHVVIEPAA